MPKNENPPAVIKKIVLDAGHGGKDPGNLGTGRYKTQEKHITLAVTLLVGKMIEKAYPEIEVIYTRTEDTYPTLYDRTAMANKAQADLFISIHCNSNQKSSARGADTFVMGLHKNDENLKLAIKENSSILLEEDYEEKYGGFDPNQPESYIELSLRQNVHIDQSLSFSAKVQKQFKEAVGRVDRGVKQAGFWVISYTTMPSVLIELGFLTNPNEEDFLNSKQGQQKMATAIFDAFSEYKTELEGIHQRILAVSEVQKEESSAKESADGLIFKVQIVTSSTRIPLEPENFNGMKGVQEYETRGMYKYTVGNETSYKAAQEVQEHAREKGYSGAFIIVFKGEERIDLQEALNLINEN